MSQLTEKLLVACRPNEMPDWLFNYNCKCILKAEAIVDEKKKKIEKQESSVLFQLMMHNYNPACFVDPR